LDELDDDDESMDVERTRSVVVGRVGWFGTALGVSKKRTVV
jgi:hypothetical protein